MNYDQEEKMLEALKGISEALKALAAAHAMYVWCESSADVRFYDYIARRIGYPELTKK